MNAETSAEPTAASPEASGKREQARQSWWRRLGVALAVVALVASGSFGYAYWSNNRPRLSDAAFAAALTEAIERGRAWVCQNPDESPVQYNNAFMYFLLQDMHRLRASPVFAERVRDFLDRPIYPSFSKRLLDPRREVSVAQMNQALKETKLDYRWLIYALAPEQVALDPAEREGLFDAGRYKGLVLAHQLWALCHMRRLCGDARVTDELLTRLCQRIAREHATDLFVTKLHSERIGFMLMAGHPELVSRRWVERLIENQRADGGWNDRLYAFTVPTPWRDKPSDEHSTLVTLWALHQVRYAHPKAFGLPPPD